MNFKTTLKSFLILSALLSVNAFAIDAYLPETRKVREKSYQVELKGRYFSTQSTYDVNGNEVELNNGDSFVMTDGSAKLRYGYGKKLEFFGGLTMRQVSATVSATATENSNSGLESYFGGIKYVLPDVKKWSFALSANYRQTAYSNTEYPSGQIAPTNEIVLGDDGSFIDFLGSIGYTHSKKTMFTLTSGYRITPDQLSSEIPYRGEVSWWGDRWAVILGFDGVNSLNEDEFADSPALKPQVSSQVTAQFNSINRSYMRVFGGLNYASKGNWRLEAEVGQIQSGTSTDKGMDIMIGLTWASKGMSTKSAKVNTFKEYIEEASVTKVSPRGKFIRIDKGITQDIDKGTKIDIFESDYFGGNVLYATGIVYEAGSDWAIVRVTQAFVNKKIKVGFTARSY